MSSRTGLRNGCYALVYGIFISLLWILPWVSVSAEPVVKIDLNKLEAISGGCRFYLVFENGTDNRFSSFKLDLVMFALDGVISKRLAVDAAPLRPGKTTVKVFDITSLTCADTGRVLINEVVACHNGSQELRNCIELVNASSRTDVALIK